MIVGIGTDIVEVARFESWADAPESRLLKIFSLSELAVCLTSDGRYVPERLAVRFAAKEAFFKALSATLTRFKLTDHIFSFMFSCQNINITTSEWGVPVLVVNWDGFEEKIQAKIPPLQVHVSLSHEKSSAIAFVVISREFC